VFTRSNYRVSQKLQVPPGLSSVWTFSPQYFRLLLWTLWTFSPPDCTLQRLRSDNWNANTRTGYFSQRTNSWPLWNWNRSLSGRFSFTIVSSNSRVKAGPHCWRGEVGMSTVSKMGEEWSVRGGGEMSRRKVRSADWVVFRIGKVDCRFGDVVGDGGCRHQRQWSTSLGRLSPGVENTAGLDKPCPLLLSHSRLICAQV